MSLLGEMFDRQLELIEKYHDIEAQSGIFNYQDGNIPVDMNSLAGQARIKDLAWRTVEEVAEFLDSDSVEDAQIECVDSLHFLLELLILAGYDEGFLEQEHTLKEFFDITPQKSISSSVRNFVEHLGIAMNALKCKPWKRTHNPTIIVSQFELSLVRTFGSYISMAKSIGIVTPEHLHSLYFRKSEVNKQRQEGDY